MTLAVGTAQHTAGRPGLWSVYTWDDPTHITLHVWIYWDPCHSS